MAARYPNAPEGVDPVEWEIHLLCDQLVQRVNERRHTLVMTARDTRQEMRERETRRQQSEQQLLATKAEIERLLKENLLRETQERILAEVELKLLEVRTPLPQTRLVFRSQLGHLEQQIAGLGEVLEEEIPMVPRYEAMRPVVAVGKEGKAPGELYYPRAVAIDSNSNQIYVAEAAYSFDQFARISIFSEGGEYLNNFTHHDMRYPHDIGIHEDNVYVSDILACSVFQFKLGNAIQLVARVGTQGSGIGQFYNPNSLAVSNNGDVYVADYNNSRIEILNSSLQHIRTLTQERITLPTDVKLTADSVYVLCNESPCIRVFSQAGEMLRSVITRGDQMQVNDPQYFWIDIAENIIISDLSAHNIKVFSKEGTHIHTIGREGEQAGQFLRPRGLALTKELKLVVVSANHINRLQIFSCQ